MPDDAHRERLLNRLSAIITRCRSKTSKSYKHYGGRGISCYEEWIENRSKFLEYIQTLPGWDDPQLDLDRIDNDGNYEPGNIRFASKSENNKNKRHVFDLTNRIKELEEENAALKAELESLRHCQCGA